MLYMLWRFFICRFFICSYRHALVRYVLFRSWYVFVHVLKTQQCLWVGVDWEYVICENILWTNYMSWLLLMLRGKTNFVSSNCHVCAHRCICMYTAKCYVITAISMCVCMCTCKHACPRMYACMPPYKSVCRCSQNVCKKRILNH
jgi:hypothetical protein